MDLLEGPRPELSLAWKPNADPELFSLLPASPRFLNSWQSGLGVNDEE